MTPIAISRGAIQAATSEIEPHRLSFGTITNMTYADPVPAALNDFVDTFTDATAYTHYSESTPGTFSVNGNVATLSHTGVQNDVMMKNVGTNITVPQFFVSIDIPSIPSPNNATYDNCGVGLVKDSNNFLFACAERINGYSHIQIKINGSMTFISTTYTGWAAPFSIGLSLVGNIATMWKKVPGGSWTAITSADTTIYNNFKTNGALAGWNAGFTYASGGSGAWNFTNFSCGRFGGLSMRDMAVATNPDGSPFFDGTKVYFTATCQGTYGFDESYCGVFTLDTATKAIAQTGVIMVNRGGAAFLDHAAHIIVYPNGDRRLSITTWGNGFGNSILLQHALFTNGSTPDILKNVSLLTVPPLTVPLGASGAGAYDPFLVYDSARSLWLLGYSIVNNTGFYGSPFYAALATSPDLLTWSLVGADAANMGYEGTRIVRANKKYWLVAGGPAGAGNSSRIYDTAMNYIGSIPGAIFNGGTVTQPHPMIFPLADGTHFGLFTFDQTKSAGGTFTWGQPSLQIAPRFW